MAWHLHRIRERSIFAQRNTDIINNKTIIWKYKN